MNFFDGSDLTDNAAALLGREVTSDIQVGLRPEHLSVAKADKAVIEGTLELVENLGEYALVHLLSREGTEFIAKTEKPPKAAKGDTISFGIKPELAHFFNKETGLRA